MQAMAQELKYYDIYWEETDKENASYYGTEELLSTEPPVIKISKHFMESGNRQSIVHYVADSYNTENEILEGDRLIWNMNGQLVLKEHYVDNRLNDSLISYYDSGKIKRLEIYRNDEMLEGTVFSEDGTILPYFPYHEMPQFPGGNWAMRNYLSNKIRYPKTGLLGRRTGTVIVTFIVGKDGTIKDVKVKQELHPVLDAEAVRVVEGMPEWEPGKTDGRPVPVRYNLPITFSK